MRLRSAVQLGVRFGCVFAVSGAAVFGAAVGARAEDDLLKLLGGETTAQKQATTQSASELRLLLQVEGPEAQIFLSHFESGDFERALFPWPVAFGGKAFAATPNGRALYGILLFKNGLAISGLETLMSVERSSDISPVLLKMWKEVANDQHPAWSFVKVNWRTEWTEIFGVAAEVRVSARGIYGAEQMDQLKELIKKTTINTSERALLQWQLVLGLALTDKAGEAAQVLANLMKAPNNPVSVDLMTMTAARLLFQNGYMDAAAQYYQKVPKSSDYWIDAQEELAWTEMRRARPQNVLAVTKTITQPVFQGQTGPESHFLRALAQLKVCDYPAVVESLGQFRDRFRSRTAQLLVLKENADSPAVGRFIQSARQKPVQLTQLKGDIHLLPRLITRDYSIRNLVQMGAAMESEGRLAEQLFLRAMGYEAMQPGAATHLAEAKKQIEARVQSAQEAVYAAIKRLAEDEIQEISAQLQKLHIVEAELLQQISVAEKRIAATRTSQPSERKGTTGSQSRDTLSFPAEKEIWFDELAHFNVDIKKGCQAKAVAQPKGAM
ncbi:MAG: hypothetical protein NDI61_14410 [Bdellovibrionaceae bacterium]|nr:hypothetical protein [Pseudobdellovibrionaceae bacterium]